MYMQTICILFLTKLYDCSYTNSNTRAMPPHRL